MASKNRTPKKSATYASRVNVLNHPVLHHKLSILRDKNTDSVQFRQVFMELSQLLTYEATRDLQLRRTQISTPLQKTMGLFIKDKIALVSIMRAGNAMLDAMMKVLPFAAVGHIGIYRDKVINNTIEYYFRLPQDIKDHRVLLVDPLLATGDTAIAAVDRLKQYGAKRIEFVCLLASPLGLKKLCRAHPDIDVCTLSIEKSLDKRGYILPGLGDAGDRLYNGLMEGYGP